MSGAGLLDRAADGDAVLDAVITCTTSNMINYRLAARHRGYVTALGGEV